MNYSKAKFPSNLNDERKIFSEKDLSPHVHFPVIMDMLRLKLTI